jgi:competence protein ComGC
MVTKLDRYNGAKAVATGENQSPRTDRALTLMEVMVVLAFIAVLAALFLWPAHLENRAKTMHAACEMNLKQIGTAFRTWEGDHNDLYPVRYYTNADDSAKYADGSNVFRYFQVMSNELYNPKVLICPSDKRDWATDFEHLKNQNVSYFVGLQADKTRPAMLLAGDRNLATNGVDVVPGVVVIKTGENVDWSAKMHNRTGIFVLADGSVEGGSGRTFQMYLSRTGTNVTRLAVP